MSRAQPRCASSSSNHALPPATVLIWSETWPTMTGHSVWPATEMPADGHHQEHHARREQRDAQADHYLATALKAPRITEAAARMADQARDAGWTHEDYLAAVLEREVSARNASGAQLRIRAAGFGAVKTLEDFDFDT